MSTLHRSRPHGEKPIERAHDAQPAVAELVRRTTLPPNEERLAALRDLIPEAFTEGRIDWEKLRAALGDLVDEWPERYAFTWAGKRDAIRMLQAPGRTTLVADREASVNFDTTEHVFIEGENLEVLKLLYKPYFGRVKMIYIDPPYNTGNDFVYPDDFADPLDTYLRLSGQRDAEGNLLTSNPETSGRYHSAWLSMMYPRLFLARQLLREDGFLAVSIGEEEVFNLHLLLNEIFGEENHRNTIAVRRYDKNLSRQFMNRGLPSLAVGFEYVLIYARTSAAMMNPVFRETSQERQTTGYWKGFWNAPDRPTMRYPLFGFTPPSGQWKWKEETAREAVNDYEEYLAQHADSKSLEEYWQETGQTKKFIRHNPSGQGMNQGVEHWIPPSTGILRTSNWTDQLASESLGSLGIPFDSPKHRELLKGLIRLLADEQDLILDFFAGSATTAHAVLELNREDGGNRRFLLVQLPEPTGREDYPTIADIGRERIRRVIRKLQDERQGAQLELEERSTEEDHGFRAFRLAGSHFRPWKEEELTGADAEAYAAQLEIMADPLLPGWTAEGVIREVALREGYGLNLRIERVEEVAEATVYRVTDPDRGQRFHLTLDEHVTLEALRPLALGRDDLFVCRDAALDDEAAANLALQCRLRTL